MPMFKLAGNRTQDWSFDDLKTLVSNEAPLEYDDATDEFIVRWRDGTEFRVALRDNVVYVS